jgi:hypothetical protein
LPKTLSATQLAIAQAYLERFGAEIMQVAMSTSHPRQHAARQVVFVRACDFLYGQGFRRLVDLCGSKRTANQLEFLNKRVPLLDQMLLRATATMRTPGDIARPGTNLGLTAINEVHASHLYSSYAGALAGPLKDPSTVAALLKMPELGQFEAKDNSPEELGRVRLFEDWTQKAHIVMLNDVYHDPEGESRAFTPATVIRLLFAQGSSDLFEWGQLPAAANDSPGPIVLGERMLLWIGHTFPESSVCDAVDEEGVWVVTSPPGAPRMVRFRPDEFTDAYPDHPACSWICDSNTASLRADEIWFPVTAPGGAAVYGGAFSASTVIPLAWTALAVVGGSRAYLFRIMEVVNPAPSHHPVASVVARTSEVPDLRSPVSAALYDRFCNTSRMFPSPLNELMMSMWPYFFATRLVYIDVRVAAMAQDYMVGRGVSVYSYRMLVAHVRDLAFKSHTYRLLRESFPEQINALISDTANFVLTSGAVQRARDMAAINGTVGPSLAAWNVQLGALGASSGSASWGPWFKVGAAVVAAVGLYYGAKRWMRSARAPGQLSWASGFAEVAKVGWTWAKDKLAPGAAWADWTGPDKPQARLTDFGAAAGLLYAAFGEEVIRWICTKCSVPNWATAAAFTVLDTVSDISSLMSLGQNYVWRVSAIYAVRRWCAHYALGVLNANAGIVPATLVHWLHNVAVVYGTLAYGSPKGSARVHAWLETIRAITVANVAATKAPQEHLLKIKASYEQYEAKQAAALAAAKAQISATGAASWLHWYHSDGMNQLLPMAPSDIPSVAVFAGPVMVQRFVRPPEVPERPLCPDLVVHGDLGAWEAALEDHPPRGVYALRPTSGMGHYPAATAANLAGAIRYRILAAPPTPPKVQAVAWKGLSYRLAPYEGVLFPLDAEVAYDDPGLTEEYLAHVEASKRARAKRAVEEIALNMLDKFSKELNSIEIRGKHNEQLEKLMPRTIATIAPTAAVFTGAPIMKIQQRFKANWGPDKGPVAASKWGPVWLVYLGAATGAEISQRADFAIQHQGVHIFVAGDDSLVVVTGPGGVVIEGDASQFDQSQSTGPLRYQHRVMRRMGAGDALISALWRLANARYVAKSKAGKIVIDRSARPMRDTGGGDTSLGNSIIMGVSWLDVILRVTELTEAALVAAFAVLGFKMKLRLHEELLSATFLKGMFWSANEGGVVWGPLPSRVIKFGKSERDPRQLWRAPGRWAEQYEPAARSFLAAQAKGYAAFALCPVLAEFAHACAGPLLEAKKPMDAPMRTEAGETVKTIDRRAAVARIAARYGCSEAEVEQCADMCALGPVLGYLDHPLFVRMGEVDYG